MLVNRIVSLVFCLAVIVPSLIAQTNLFVSAKGGSLYLGKKQYTFVGTNYWYGSVLGLEKDKRRGIGRLRKELDFLKSQGVTNLRLMGGAEGTGALNGVIRVGPSLQPEQGRFDESVLDGLDIVLAEMAKRKMKAVIFLSNNWEWSGGFQQYLIWNKVVSDELLTRKPDWDELRDVVSKFYTCKPCTDGYWKQAELIIGRTNKLTGKRYAADPTIMSWEIANEPRPMRPVSNDAYRDWLKSTTAAIKRKDRNHLITIGHEGWIGTENIKLFEEIHADPNVDYLTIHIWPKNWGWFENGKLAEGFEGAVDKSTEYIKANTAVAERLKKPLVIEEFGLPRDGQSFDPASSTGYRDRYYDKILSFVLQERIIVGANFWAFGGTARPVKGQIFWRPGDELMGDPPMEEQGLNTVFDSDKSTWKVISRHARRFQSDNLHSSDLLSLIVEIAH
ncbi:MAG: cellulase family glycosylhydrolase [Pyrinomonadaceae bacterium]|nr:cellulase family glycosylhydrolase [Pyrinomonadaceae bacterium]MBP6211473.1 cellulase family glycosylhydrolase [Pyrinomonadaceae bacterium]